MSLFSVSAASFSALAFGLLSFAASSANAGGENVEMKAMRCVNKMYRDSSLEIREQDTLQIKDSHPVGTEEIAREFERQFELRPNSLMADTVTLSVPTKKLNCSLLGKLPLSCAAAAGEVLVSLRAWVHTISDRGGSGVVNLTLPANLNKFQLNGALRSRNGTITIGSGTTTVKMDNYAVRADADIELGGRSITLGYQTFFHTAKSSKHVSGCDL